MEKTSYFYSVAETEFGEAGVVGRQNGDRLVVFRIMLPEKTCKVAKRVEREFPGAVCKSGAGCRICINISGFFQGREVVFDPADIDAALVQGFARRVLTKIAEIPRGYVMTYGGVAADVGVPGGARAVGNALAGNPFPLFFPCHRVIRGNGTLGGFGGGVEMKRRLLKLEGVSFDRSGRVAPDRIMGSKT